MDGVSFDVAEGEAHALVGENGAGKSTLLKILAGLVAPDAGEMPWRGQRLSVSSPRDAIERGIGMVYQEMLCFPNLSVSANIFAGREVCRWGRLREPEMRERTREVLARLRSTIDPDARAEQLSAAHRQLLQVARALAFKCQILVLDEPTTALTDAEADHLFEVLRDLEGGGTTFLYVSHRLPEVFRLCDRITVLRDGGWSRPTSAPPSRPAHGPRDGGARSSRTIRRSRWSQATAAPRASGPQRTDHSRSVTSSALRDVSMMSRRRNRRPLWAGGIGPLGAARNRVRPAPPDSGGIEIDGTHVRFDPR